MVFPPAELPNPKQPTTLNCPGCGGRVEFYPHFVFSSSVQFLTCPTCKRQVKIERYGDNPPTIKLTGDQ